MKKLVRITTVPESLNKLLEGQLSFMSDYYDVIAVSSNKEKLDEVGHKEKVRTFCVNLTRKITPFNDVKSVISLYSFLRKEKPHIVHTHTPKAGIVGMLASYLAGVPHRFHTVAGLPLLETTGFKRKVLNFVELITYKLATKVYPNSFGLKNIIITNKFCKEKKLKVLGAGSSNGIDTNYFNPKNISEEKKKELKKKLNISENDFVFIFVGRIVSDKGINELVSAFSSFGKEDAKLLLVGKLESELDPLKEKTLLEISNNKNIISLGYQNDVRPFFAISDVFTFPSYREGFPNVVMQAAAMGVPSIVSNINGCNEIIEDNVNGIIIPPKSKNDMLLSMKKLYDNKAIREQLASKSRVRVVNNYNQKFIWNELLKEYIKTS